MISHKPPYADPYETWTHDWWLMSLYSMKRETLQEPCCVQAAWLCDLLPFPLGENPWQRLPTAGRRHCQVDATCGCNIWNIWNMWIQAWFSEDPLLLCWSNLSFIGNMNPRRMRRATSGVSETILPFGDIYFTLVDVGGQRSERRKWWQNHLIFLNIKAAWKKLWIHPFQ